MKKYSFFLSLIALLIVLSSIAVPGIYALWYYYNVPSAIDTTVSNSLSQFEYGLIYITQIRQADPAGDHISASAEKIAATNIHADINLGTAANASASYMITFYNSTDTVYYYNEAQTLSKNDSSIAHSVTGIAQKDVVEPKTYRTLTITFTNGQVATTSPLSADIHFSFVVDKDSIGIIVAKTAVDRFRDILNNVAAADSYSTLETAMNNRGNVSTVTYIGNVTGSGTDDTQIVEDLFGNEFMSMDLDGDGTAERITMMIKRENLDNNVSTGASYTYSSWLGNRTVHGVEMTLYITAEDVSARSVTVYAATFTIPEGGSEWVEIVPLTKGSASTNNYNSGSIGSKNSFNTDTWTSDGGKTMAQLTKEATG